MKQQKYYKTLQQHIILLIGLSLIPGLVYVLFGWIFKIVLPAFIWYSALIMVSIWGVKLYKEFANQQMTEVHLKAWYKQLSWFMYTIFSSWTVIFIFYAQETINHLNYIAIFTQLGASVIASTLLVSDKKLYTPILMMLLLPLALYFSLFHTWYGYVLSLFTLIFMVVLHYSASNTNTLLEESYFHAHHDSLTKLYNRKHFTEYMEALYRRLKRHDTIVYVSLIDLDHFKTINDSLGHDFGDKLLITVSERLAKYAKGTHLVCRLGGDEFVLVSNELIGDEIIHNEACDSAQKLLKIIREPYYLEGHVLRITASIGLYKLDPLTATYDENSFIKEVDIAMYEAKARGRDGVILFNRDLALTVDRHLLIEQKLYDALKKKAMEVYYQPQFNKEAKLSGCEALLRWTDSELGMVTPDEFIPIAETTGLILEVGSYVLRETFGVLRYWNNKGYYFDSFSINISIRQLIYDPFYDEVEGLMKEYFPNRNKNQKIFFEITEHVFAQDMKKVICVMNKIKDLGISFSIDDFGTGYSSLSYLKELPVDEVKIDKSFVDTVGEIDTATNMIKTIVSIAKNFNFKIVAEGVETLEQFDLLVAENCDIFQGFHFDKAITKEAFEKKYFS